MGTDDTLPGLLARASAAARSGEPLAAAALYEQATSLAPARADLRFNLGNALEQAGEHPAAARAYLAACRLAPRDARLALFAGAALHAAGRRADAAVMFSLADGAQPGLFAGRDDPRLHPELRRRIGLADAELRANFAALHAAAVDEVEHELGLPAGAPALARIREAVWVQTHPAPVHFRTPLQQPGIFYVPGLPAEPVTARERLPWAKAIEAATAAIRAEYLQAVAAGQPMAPYVEAEVRSPLWAGLRGRPDWSSLHLYKGATEQPAARRFPRTLAAIAAAEVFRVGHERPMEVFFSRLAPGTHIPPHFGVANHRITVHLPLIVPAGCAIRVGDRECHWREGEILAFDDSFEHEAWNRGNGERVVLIFESFHPDLHEPERRAIERSYARRGEWLGARRIPGDGDPPALQPGPAAFYAGSGSGGAEVP